MKTQELTLGNMNEVDNRRVRVENIVYWRQIIIQTPFLLAERSKIGGSVRDEV